MLRDLLNVKKALGSRAVPWEGRCVLNGLVTSARAQTVGTTHRRACAPCLGLQTQGSNRRPSISDWSEVCASRPQARDLWFQDDSRRWLLLRRPAEEEERVA